MTIRFTAMVAPRGKQRARTVTLGNGRKTSYTPQETVEFERRIAWACKKACRGMKFAAGTPLKMWLGLYMPIPKSAGKRLAERLNGQWHTKKPDRDNCEKAVLDALNGLAYEDDAQIAYTESFKVYSDCPRVEVMITELESRKGTDYVED